MHIHKLPPELLQCIIEYSLPYAFEDLVLTSKHIYSIAASFLSHHNELRRRYRSFKFISSYTTTPRDVTVTKTVPELLLEIANDPVIASYILHADLGNRECTGGINKYGPEHREVLPRLGPRKEQQKVINLIRQSGHLEALGLDVEQWSTRILTGDDEFDEQVDCLIAFLLTLLVNVESLTLPSQWRAASIDPDETRDGSLNQLQLGVSELMQLLVKRANDSSLQAQPLQKLRILYPTTNADGQFGERMVTISPFLALNSLREVYHVSGIFDHNDRRDNYGRWVSYPNIGAQLEIIELTDYIIDNGAFFRNMSQLRILRFEYAMKDEYGDEWNAGGFVDSLMAAVGETLQILSLKLGWVNKIEEPVCNLQGFKKLRELELHTRLLYEWETNEDIECKTERLIDILHPTMGSLETFCLHAPASAPDFACLQELFQDFESARGRQLPTLRKVKVVIIRDVWYSDYELNTREEHVKVARSFCETIAGIDVQVTGRYER